MFINAFDIGAFLYLISIPKLETSAPYSYCLNTFYMFINAFDIGAFLYPSFSILFLKDELKDSKLHQHGYAHHYERSDKGMDSYMHTGREEHGMQQEVYGMATREAYEAVPRWSGAEREDAGKIEVYRKTYDVAYDVSEAGGIGTRHILYDAGKVRVYHHERYQIDNVVYSCRHATINDKSYELRLALIAVLYGCYNLSYIHILLNDYFLV